MDTSRTSSRAREADIAAATAHLAESWEHGKEAASDARRIASRTVRNLYRDVDDYVGSRPKVTALAALGVGLVAGFLSGLLASRILHASSTVD